MTDVASVPAHADPQPASRDPDADHPPLLSYANGSPGLDGAVDEEESSTIKCICGFSDDDGNTVLCEKCDTWQHIVCYYESPEKVPDVHECTDCQPRAVDKKRAYEKQIQRRELHLNTAGERKGRPRSTTKNHKKRVKDPLGLVQPNGWPVSSYDSERKSGSPRDQPPPSKRPKTSHRASGSMSLVVSQAPALAPASRKRASSTVPNGYSPVKSPADSDGPIEHYSIEFMNLYRQPDPPSTDSNLYTDIRVANDISLWLNDRDALAEATGGLQPGDIFDRIDQPIEQIDTLAPVIRRHIVDNPSITAHGLHPRWESLVVETFVPTHSYIGELKGRIGRKEDYYSDPSNRWDLLRHPEPFVFFPPHLPIYIDARHEGTKLRYIRRSCDPNVKMKILTQGSESGYHFCFVATKDIEADTELTVGWEIDPEIRQRLEEGLNKIVPWVTGVLSNFGGCACDTSRRECLLERARRPLHSEPTPPAKPTKGKKVKKSHVSPLSTGHATNSRAGSEAFHRNGAPEEDHAMDSRSTSGSHKSTSRDITPATHFSVDGGDLKMSDRERRKLQQQERLFEQLEYEEQHKGKRGKRASAASTLNTPTLSSSKQLGQSEHSPCSNNPREHSNGIARKASASSRTNGHAASKSKPVYVDTSTQTEDDPPSISPAQSTVARLRKIPLRPISFKQKLLQQAAEDRLQRERNRAGSVKMEAGSPALKDVASSKPSPTRPLALAEEPTAMDISTDAEPADASTPVKNGKQSTPLPPMDVEMKDADETTLPTSPSPKVEPMPDAPNGLSTNASQITLQPPLPPPRPTINPTSAEDLSPKPVDLRVQPPPPESNHATASINSVVTPGSVSGSVIAQSPVGTSALSPFSPSVSNATNLGPARKKLSLSDYTHRRKMAQTQTSATPPATQPHATSSPTLSTTSLPNQTSPPAKTPEPGVLPTVAEEAK